MNEDDLADFRLHGAGAGAPLAPGVLCRVCREPVDTLVGNARVSYVRFDDETVECLSHGGRR